jgi:signal transduction histidine kinase
MLNSIKIKFTIAFSAVLTLVILLLANLIYVFGVRPAAPRINKEDLQRLSDTNPTITKFIKERKVLSLDQAADLSSTLEDIQRERFKSTLVKVTIPIIIISTIFAYLLSSYLVKPIEELSVQISHIHPWELERRIPIRNSSEEIEILTSKFNNLMGRLERSFKSQEEFIQDAAHELRTPIAAILSTIEVLKDKDEITKKDYESTINTVELLSKKLNNLNESLLILNRQNTTENNTTNINLREVIQEVVESFASASKKKRIEITNKVSDKTNILGDEKSLARAFQNVIQNAVKYTPKKGKILITSKQSKDNIIVKIKDTGPGIPPEDLPNIFKRFYRGHNGQNLDIAGSGLGLSITKKIVEDHNGRINVKNAPKEGTIVGITLPLNKRINRKSL